MKEIFLKEKMILKEWFSITKPCTRPIKTVARPDTFLNIITKHTTKTRVKEQQKKYNESLRRKYQLEYN